MDNLSKATIVFLLCCIIVILQFQPAALEVEGGSPNVAQNDPEKPFLSQIMMDTISLLRKSHKSSWEKIKTVVHDLQMQFSPPNLDFRGMGEAEPEQGLGGVKGTVKDAVGKSFDKGREAVEESAKSAAKVVGEAFHMTGEKESSSQKESEAEL